jgi:Mor family transcriptional regulator
MAYQKITLELVVFADEAASVVAELNEVIDQLDEKHTIFGGEIEIASIQHSGKRSKSALRLTLAAGGVGAGAIRLAAGKVASAYKRVI